MFIIKCTIIIIIAETEVQKVIVTLDNCPKKVTNNSIIRIYPPWLTVESKTTEMLLLIGVIHAEVVENSLSNKIYKPTGMFTNVKGLMSSVYQSEILWKCNCSKGTQIMPVYLMDLVLKK